MHLFKGRGFALNWTLLLIALTRTGVSRQTGWLRWEAKEKRVVFNDDAVVCRNGDGIFIEDVTFLKKTSCPRSGQTNNTRLTDDFVKAAVRRDCGGQLKCGTRNVLDLLEKYKCDDGSTPITSITLLHRCKPFDLMKHSKVVLDMCKQFERKISNNDVTNSLVLKSNISDYQRCLIKAHESNKNITLKTLQVDFGSQCDTTDNCAGLVEIYVDKVQSSKQKKNLGGNPMTFSGRQFELNIYMPTGRLVWLELNANFNDTINCTRKVDCSDVNNEDKDNDDKNNGFGNNDDSDRVIVIVTSLVAVVVTITLICLCALLLCRVRSKRRESVHQNGMLYKPGCHYDDVSADDDTRVSPGAPPTSESGIYDLAKQHLSEEKINRNLTEERVGEIYSEVNQVLHSEAASAPSTVNGETNEKGVPNSVTDRDEYSHLAHFKVETRITENVYDG
ncbi:unnamed protein product [Lymnaea stagnalis]|uniref:SUEL-type lectin domain-containing protein n=1 Tax=Lymnaea stagnalis TaxID=6523 RepID=A0AAV2I970_LYMST